MLHEGALIYPHTHQHVPNSADQRERKSKSHEGTRPEPEQPPINVGGAMARACSFG